MHQIVRAGEQVGRQIKIKEIFHEKEGKNCNIENFKMQLIVNEKTKMI